MDGKREIILPHDLNVERAIIASVLIDDSKACAFYACDRLQEKHFYRQSHALFFRAIRAALGENLSIDVVTLCRILDDWGKLNEAGGPAAISAVLDTGVPVSLATVGTHVEILKELYTRRQQVTMASRLYRLAVSGELTSMEILERLESAIRELYQERQTGDGLESVFGLVAEQVGKIDAGNASAVMSMVGTGYEQIDAQAFGLARGDLAIIAGRPGAGKTAFATQMAWQMAHQGSSVAFFSMEMGKAQFAMRTACSIGCIPINMYKSGYLSESDRQRADNALNYLAESAKFYVDHDRLTIPQVWGRAQTHKALHGLDAVYVDYMQFAKPSPVSDRINRERQVAIIADDLKEMSKALDVPVIALSQLNREKSHYERPSLQELRESGNIEQAADFVGFLWRGEGYDDNPERGIIQFACDKFRNGPVFQATFDFLKPYTRFMES